MDNGSSEGTAAYLADLVASRPGGVSIKAIFEAKPGTGAAKNTGWREACGAIIAFTDDDCYVSDDYLDQVVVDFQQHPEIGFLGGRVLLFDPTDQRITIHEHPYEVRYRPNSYIPAGAIHGANMAFRKTALEACGGFDEKFGAGAAFSCEDIDAMAATLWRGYAGLYDPNLVLYHHHGRRFPHEAATLMKNYDIGRGAYFMKFLLRGETRLSYARAWIRWISKDCWDSLRAGRLPQRSVWEIHGALKYVISI